MTSADQTIMTTLSTIQARTEVRYATYARQYESFRRLPECVEGPDRELQISIAYLYHTSLSILEERRRALAEYIEDVRDVLSSFADMTDLEKVDELRSSIAAECREEVIDLEKELRQIDRGITMAHRHESQLMAD
jgi:hypothetical protein